jgi:hypothetical protein
VHRWGQIDRGTHTHTHTHMCIPLKLTIILCWRHCWTPEVAEAIRASAQNGCKMKNPTNNACARAVIHLRIYTHWSHTCACPSTRAGRSSSQWLRNQQVFSHMISHMHVLTLSLTHTHTHTHTHTYTHTHTRTHTHTQTHTHAHTHTHTHIHTHIPQALAAAPLSSSRDGRPSIGGIGGGSSNRQGFAWCS